MQVRWFCEGARNTEFLPMKDHRCTLVVFTGLSAWVRMETADTWITTWGFASRSDGGKGAAHALFLSSDSKWL